MPVVVLPLGADGADDGGICAGGDVEQVAVERLSLGRHYLRKGVCLIELIIKMGKILLGRRHPPSRKGRNVYQ